MVGLNFLYEITANNNPSGYGAVTLPSGLSLDNASGVISGVPTRSGTYTVALAGTNPAGNATANLVVTISAEKPVITSGTVASGTVGLLYHYGISAVNDPSTYAASGLPSGLEVNPATGDIVGIPAIPGSYAVTLSAIASGTGISSGTGTSVLNLTIVNNGPATPVITSPWIVYNVTNTAFNYAIKAANNPTSYTAGGLPSGLSINSTTGVISGTSGAVGTHLLNLGAVNSTGTATSQLLYVVESATSSVSATVQLQAGKSPFLSYQTASATILSDASDAASVNTIQSGLSVGNFGTTINRGLIGFDLSMLPPDATTTSGSLTLYVTTASEHASMVKLYQPATLFYPGAATWSANSGTAALLGSMNLSVSLSGTDLPRTWVLNSSFLSAAQNALQYATPLQFMLLDSNGEANPDGIQNTFTFAPDDDNSAGQPPLLTVNYTTASPPVIIPGQVAYATVGSTLFSYQASILHNPVSISASNLPPGLSLNSSTGIISGSVSATGTYAVALSASNANGIGSGTMTIGCGYPPVISSGSTVTGTAGSTLNDTITTSNGGHDIQRFQSSQWIVH